MNGFFWVTLGLFVLYLILGSRGLAIILLSGVLGGIVAAFVGGPSWAIGGGMMGMFVGAAGFWRFSRQHSLLL